MPFMFSGSPVSDPLAAGDGQAAFASDDFYAADAPRIGLRRPGRHWHLAKIAVEKFWMRRWT